MTREFEAFNKEYYCDAIKRGDITVDGRAVSVSFILKDRQRIRHRMRMVEPPVPLVSTTILATGHAHFESIRIFAVEKPSGIPVHPGAAYRFNSLLEIVKNQSGIFCEDCAKRRLEDITTHNTMAIEELRLGQRSIPKVLPASLSPTTLSSHPHCCLLSSINRTTLRPLHRLDRLTSGIVVLGTDSETAHRFEVAFRQGRITKTYLARVVGNFSHVCFDSSQPDINNAVPLRNENETSPGRLRRLLRGEILCTLLKKYKKHP